MIMTALRCPVFALAISAKASDAFEEAQQRPRLGSGQVVEECRLCLLKRPIQLLEASAAVRGGGNEVATPISRIGAAGDLPPALHGSEREDDVAGVDSAAAGKVSLTGGAELNKVRQQGIVPRM